MLLIIVDMRERTGTSQPLFAVDPSIARQRVLGGHLMRVGARFAFEGTLGSVVAWLS